MKTKIVPRSWLNETGMRLDCNPYLSGGLDARMHLEQLTCKKESLGSLTTGIYHAGREGRQWVTSEEYGVPFMGSTDILKADLNNLPLISQQQVDKNPGFLLREGWTLVTRSGTIGRMAYARKDIDGFACSEHVMRIKPDTNKVRAGYIYAFLSSKYGVPQVISGTYGSIIQSIEPHHVSSLPVPRLADNLEKEVHCLVELASKKRTKAIDLLNQAKVELNYVIGIEEPKQSGAEQKYTIVSSRDLSARCDAYYFSQINMHYREDWNNSKYPCVKLRDVADVFIPNIFKRLYSPDKKFGYPYITGADVFQLAPTSEKYLIKKVAEGNRLVLKKNMIVIQEAGQLGGLIGRSVMVGEYLDGFACTNNMVRVKPDSEMDSGYIYTLLSSEHGVNLISRESAGSSIPHIEESRVANLMIPWPGEDVRHRIGELAIAARNLRDMASSLEEEARKRLEDAIEGVN
ncbi:methylation-associated defense system restriction endonuclease subunit S MAD5 [Vibrio owensii]|uniref:methylation-associated defense system restriction endonuclease subunit S MAD5 n=1 Tax=Vibrio owensii TaxID=696485 RepID=UPI004067CB5E